MLLDCGIVVGERSEYFDGLTSVGEEKITDAIRPNRINKRRSAKDHALSAVTRNIRYVFCRFENIYGRFFSPLLRLSNRNSFDIHRRRLGAIKPVDGEYVSETCCRRPAKATEFAYGRKSLRCVLLDYSFTDVRNHDVPVSSV